MVQYADENYDGEEHDVEICNLFHDALDELPETLNESESHGTQ